MATFDYARAAATAKRLIERFGNPIMLVNSSEGSYDPVTGVDTPAGETSIMATGVILPVNTKDAGGGFPEGSLIRKDDSVVLLEAVDFPITSSTQLVVASGREWNIAFVLPLAPDSVNVVLYKLIIRQ